MLRYFQKSTAYIFGFILFMICSATLSHDNVHAATKDIKMYDMSQAPKFLQKLYIPDFLAFVSGNTEVTPPTALHKGYFTSGDNVREFFLGAKYLQKYGEKLASYLDFLEKNGFKFKSGWEGFYTLEKKINGAYVQLIVGSYMTDIEGIGIIISVDKQAHPPAPSYHNVRWNE